MTPLIREMVALTPEPEKAMWFDVGRIPNSGATLSVGALMHTPFRVTSVVGLDTSGEKFAIWMIAADNSVTLAGVTMGRRIRYFDPFCVMRTEEGFAFYKGEEKVNESEARVAVGMALVCLSLIDRASDAYKGTPSRRSPTNARRIAKGKPPLVYDWHTVKLEPKKAAPEPQGGTHATPRRHQCRGHWRTCKSGKRVWVKDCWRGDASKGTVFKDYEVKS